MAAFLFVFIVILIFVFYNFHYKRKGLPPGPIPLPFFGNSLTLMRHPPGEDIFLEWRQRFGPIFTFWLGETPVICIAEYNKIVEYYQRGGEAFAGRHAIEAYERIIRGGIYGVLQTEGEIWREHRRFVLHVFRDFGVGKNIMQERILTEISEMFKLLDLEINEQQKLNEIEIDIVKHLERAISSIINVLLVGFRFDEEAILFDLWISGQETTTTALSWGIALLLHNPSVMEKVQEELDNKFGNEQELVSWSDRSSLPYTCAVVNEILRVGNVVAQDFPHRMMKDTKVDKWLLRKGQPIVAQISVVLVDPNISPGDSFPSLKREIGIPVLCPKFTCRVIKRWKKTIQI
uniref:Cytochrome P450 n=1 Tax=Meloidogyne floridensis TaxID=298350 RepID=A0A915NIL0_9BILA